MSTETYGWPCASAVKHNSGKSFTIEALLGKRSERTSSPNGTGLYQQTATNVPSPARMCAPVPPYLYPPHLAHFQPLYYAPYALRGALYAPDLPSKSNLQSFKHRGGKSKRMRTSFTNEQLSRLEKEFARQQYMVGSERFILASSLQLTEAQVKVWFQNRRIKFRKQSLEQQNAKLAQGGVRSPIQKSPGSQGRGDEEDEGAEFSDTDIDVDT